MNKKILDTMSGPSFFPCDNSCIIRHLLLLICMCAAPPALPGQTAYESLRAGDAAYDRSNWSEAERTRVAETLNEWRGAPPVQMEAVAVYGETEASRTFGVRLRPPAEVSPERLALWKA